MGEREYTKCGCSDSASGHREVVLKFSREQLMYDIENYCWIEGHVMSTEDTHQRHMVQDVGEGGNVDRITRVMNLSFSQVREILYPYFQREIEREVYDDNLREPKQYGIVMSLPDGFSETTVVVITNLIHEYVVSRCVMEWMSMTNPSKVELWQMKSEVMLHELRTSLNARRGRIRRRVHPF